MHNLIDYEFTPKIEYYFKYEINVETAKETLTQIVLLDEYIEKKEGEKHLIVEENKKNKITTDNAEIGDCLTLFLNLYNNKETVFKKTLFTFKELFEICLEIPTRLPNGEILSINILKALLTFFNNCPIERYYSLLVPDIINCLWYMEYHIPKYRGLLYTKIEQWKKVENFDSTCKNRVDELQEQINILESKEFFDKQCLKCLTILNDKFEYIIKLVNDSFDITTSQTKIFSGINLNIPSCEVEYNTENKHPKAKKYTFKIYDIKELALVSIYMFDKVKRTRIIRKCKHCENYFIPEHNSKEYCKNVIKTNENGEKITCEKIGEKKSFKYKYYQTSETDDSFYHAIYARLSGNQKYKDELDKFLKRYYEICDKFKNDKEKLNAEKYKFLVEFDKEFQKAHKNKKGKPYTTMKYWNE